MGKTKQYWLLTALLMVGILGIGYFVGVKPQTVKAAKLRADADAVRMTNGALQADISRLQKQSEGVLAQQNRLKQIAVVLPDNPSLPKLVRSLTAIRQATGVAIDTLAPGAPTIVPAAATPLPAAVKTAGTDSPGASATPATPLPATQPGAASAGALATLPVVLALTGNFSQVQLFLAKLEKLDRSFVVSTISITPGAEPATGASAPVAAVKPGQLTVSISGNVFMKVPAPIVPKTPTAPAEK